MGNKIVWITIIVGAILIWELFGFAIHPLFRDVAAIVVAEPTVGNATGITEAANSFPLWIMILPVVVGVIAVIMILRAPEKK